MLNVDIQALEKAVEDMRGVLKEGLIATDVWDRSTGLSLVGHNAQPEAVALFNQLTDEISNTLNHAGFPGLRNYYLLDLDQDNLVLIMKHGEDLLQGTLLAAKKVNIGIVFSIVIPRTLEAVRKAQAG